MFDDETTIDPSQRLLVLVWRFYRDDPDHPAAVTCIEEGIVYPDDLPDRRPRRISGPGRLRQRSDR